MNFKICYTTHEAAKYAVENWHYSKCLPTGKLVKFGIWEDEKFIGVIIYSSGACPQIAQPFCLERLEVCELTRIALNKHKNPVSKFLSITLKLLKKKMPKMKLIVSYADPEQDHYGIIYQATNWIYLGKTKPTEHFISNKGFKIHSKTLRTNSKGLATRLLKEGKIKQIFSFKYKYVYALDETVKKNLINKTKDYPKRACVV